MTINPISPTNVSPIKFSPVAPATSPNRIDQPSFKDFLIDSIEHVNTMQQDADRAVQQLMTGGEVDTAEVLTAVQKADISFRMMLQIHNKLVQAYQEINQIRV
jgi:flagellar hook-basal body complex protein FliE